MTDYTLSGLFIGQPEPLPEGSPSAIYKQAVDGRIRVEAEGLAGDAQADPDNHGGPERAVHHYPVEHYDHWRATFDDFEAWGPGSFGENLSIAGLTEADVHVGDVFTLGETRLELSQPRWPCWKPADRLGIKTLTRHMIGHGRAGWFYRVLEPGTIGVGDRLTRVAVAEHGITLARLWTLKNTAEPDAAMQKEIDFMIDYDRLAPAWRERLR